MRVSKKHRWSNFGCFAKISVFPNKAIWGCESEERDLLEMGNKTDELDKKGNANEENQKTTGRELPQYS